MPKPKEDFFEARVLPMTKEELQLMIDAVNYKMYYKPSKREAYIKLHSKLMYDFVAKGGSLKELE